MQIILSIFFFVSLAINSKGQGCCDMDAILKICYTAADDYCPTGASCRYTLDAEFMEGLYQKLDNPANFGPSGISTCEIELAPLQNINVVEDIENLSCDIILIGNFALDNNGGFGTHLETSFLNTIREWSLKCLNNLTIVFQGESAVWGYAVEDENANPNVPGTLANPNIFDGTFGTITEFSQGGGFQANFSVLPPTGSTILGMDANGRPTIVLDDFTNDLILADVGIFCNTVGFVTDLPIVTSNNDVLVCNIMNLGCEIASQEEFVEEFIFICTGESYILPSGEEVSLPGEYTTELIGMDNCDSIIITHLEYSIPDDFFLDYVGCQNDGYSVQIGSVTYDESNPSGQTTIQNEYNCDSTVIVDLTFNPNTIGAFNATICFDENIDFHGNTFSGDIDTSIIIENSFGCDSIIAVSINTLAFEEVVIPSQITIENNAAYLFENTIPLGYSVQWSPSSGLNCTDCPNPILNNTENINTYEVTVTSPDGCEFFQQIEMSYLCTPYLPNIFNPNSDSGNDSFRPLAPCTLENYALIIYDRWGSKVFQSEDQEESWNGRLQNDIVITGVYVYQLKFSNNNQETIRSGTLSLVL